LDADFFVVVFFFATAIINLLFWRRLGSLERRGPW